MSGREVSPGISTQVIFIVRRLSVGNSLTYIVLSGQEIPGVYDSGYTDIVRIDFATFCGY